MQKYEYLYFFMEDPLNPDKLVEQVDFYVSNGWSRDKSLETNIMMRLFCFKKKLPDEKEVVLTFEVAGALLRTHNIIYLGFGHPNVDDFHKIQNNFINSITDKYFLEKLHWHFDT